MAFFVIAGFAPLANAQSQSQAVRDKNVEAQLISSHSSIQAGKEFTLGLKFKIDPTWHTYWSNPGLTGKPTIVRLTLPPGFTVGELQFPTPKRFVTDFGFNIVEAGFGYEGEVIHPVTITPPADLAPGSAVSIIANAEWLMCDPNTCVPGKATLSLSLPVAEMAAPSKEASSIKKALSKVPEEKDWETEIALNGENLEVTIAVPAGELADDAKLQFFPDKNEIFDQLSDPEPTKTAEGVTFAFKKFEKLESAPESFSGVLIAETADGKTGYRVSNGEAEAPTPEVTKTETPEETTETAADEPEELPFGGGFLGILLAAFLGGMILNIMPCVFPVISLKVLSFVGQAGEDRRKVFLHALSFTFGILVFFWLLVTVLLTIRAVTGESVGWGSQLQHPGYVLGLIIIMVLVALSLFGVFEIGASMTSVGGDLANKSGYAGSFWSGALAVLLATPCTAPLMAPAITFALAQPAIVTFTVLTALGLGLAAPYFVFAIFPKLLDVIPPPGGWMDTFKQFMGFPMLAVAVWLTGVLSVQLNVGGLQWALAAVLFVGVAAWIFGRYGSFDRSVKTRRIGAVVALAVFGLSLYVAYGAIQKRPPADETDISAIIAEHRAAGKHVFVDFTAEWCATCKVNERATIKTEPVQTAFKENNVEFVVADWTNQNPNITKILKENGRSGVPLYLLYPADESEKPFRFKDGLITTTDILKAIEDLK